MLAIKIKLTCRKEDLIPENVFFKLHFMQLFSANDTLFKKNKKNFVAPKKVDDNLPRPTVFSHASFCFVQRRQFFSLKFSHL